MTLSLTLFFKRDLGGIKEEKIKALNSKCSLNYKKSDMNIFEFLLYNSFCHIFIFSTRIKKKDQIQIVVYIQV